MISAGALSNCSLVVITRNEQDRIARCLESVPGVGEIIVVDSFSTDRTVEIARLHGARVFQREFKSAGDQKNWAMGKAEKDWILVLDADETLSSELVREISEALGAPRGEGYRIRRRSEFLGARIRFCGWHNDWIIRLFRRGKGLYPEREVHEELRFEGPAPRLAGVIEHRPYRDLDDYVDRMKSYSRRGAAELDRRGSPWFPGIVTHPIARFIRMYVLQLGFLDGGYGFVLCMLASVGVFLKYAFVRELSAGRVRGKAGAA
ncbi:MAG: glycosyltransferase family 2 protein [Candidatus Krumholzibacteria bacterium]|nr:glycosyltransferase family 2 protein [Candidatus Krumholzibacteria bacterium]